MGGRTRRIKKKFEQERQNLAQHIQPKTENQAKYLKALQTDLVVIATGHAGVGKTFCAASVAANKLLKGEVDKIILVRPYVGMGKSSGFWPGTIEEKLTPYLAPMLQTLKERLGVQNFENLKGKSILIQPMEAVRGMSFDDAVIIVDESQNTTPEEVKSLTTRIGENTQIVFCGDPRQTDIKGLNGLDYIADFVVRNKISQSTVITFTVEDVVRSGICAEFVKAYEREGNK